MNTTTDFRNESNVAMAFTNQSVVFDSIYRNDVIVQYKRQRVREHVLKYLPPNSVMLELNAGTGEDAIYFARQGHRVHATDISSGMQDVLKRKVMQAGLRHQISTELCSFNNLEQLQQKGPYDAIFSNLAGLNCTDRLDKVVQSLAPLLK